MEVILGILVGSALALCVGLLLFLVRKNPQQVKHVFLSFLRTRRRSNATSQ